MKLQVPLAVLLPLIFSAVCFSQVSLSPSASFNAPSPILNYAAEPGWYPFIVARGQDRTQIQNTPMHARPYRPMHFYGNTVRRMAHRGTPVPMPRDFARSATTLILRRN